MKIGNLIRMLCSSFKFVIKMLCDLNGWLFFNYYFENGGGILFVRV